MFNFNRYRKRMFVSSRIQGRLMSRIGVYWVLYHVVLWHGLFVFRYLQYRMTAAGGIAVPFSELYGQFVIDYYPVVVCALVTLPVVVIDMLHMTHRVAGPLVRFQNALRDLVEGKPVESVSLRKNDLLNEFQDEFNQYLAVLSRERRQLRTGADSHPSGSDDGEGVAAELAELHSAVRTAVSASESAPEERSPSATSVTG
jgi:hypothetical protein